MYALLSPRLPGLLALSDTEGEVDGFLRLKANIYESDDPPGYSE